MAELPFDADRLPLCRFAGTVRAVQLHSGVHVTGATPGDWIISDAEASWILQDAEFRAVYAYANGVFAHRPVRALRVEQPVTLASGVLARAGSWLCFADGLVLCLPGHLRDLPELS